MTDLVTADGRAAVTIQGLARLIGCHRDQIRLWRQEGGPADLDLRAWHTWLTEKRRWHFAASLEPCLLPDDIAQPEPSPAAAGGTPAAAMSVESKEDADRRFARLRADKMQRDLDEMDGRLVDRALLGRAIGRLSALVVDRLQRGIWEALLPALDGATADVRRGAREAHDRAILAMRADLGPGAVRQVLADVLPHKDSHP